MGGEVVALDRHFFRSVGGYDPGMLLWGEEQIELSVRVRRTGSANPHRFYLLMTPRAMTECSGLTRLLLRAQGMLCWDTMLSANGNLRLHPGIWECLGHLTRKWRKNVDCLCLVTISCSLEEYTVARKHKNTTLKTKKTQHCSFRMQNIKQHTQHNNFYEIVPKAFHKP